MNLVSAEGLCWQSRGRRVLGPVGLTVTQGETVAIIGPNGAGKTTLLRLLVGVLEPSSGAVVWSGNEGSRLSARDRAAKVAYVPQVRPAYVPLTVEQLVLLGRFPYLRRWGLAPGTDDWAAVEKALRTVGLEAIRDQRIDRLSGGERQAAYIAAALAQGGGLLVLDEPTAHLDPRHQREVAELLARLVAEEGRAVVAATHDLQLASLIGGRIIALKDGRVEIEGTVESVLSADSLEQLFEAPFNLVNIEGRRVPVLELRQ